MAGLGRHALSATETGAQAGAGERVAEGTGTWVPGSERGPDPVEHLFRLGADVVYYNRMANVHVRGHDLLDRFIAGRLARDAADGLLAQQGQFALGLGEIEDPDQGSAGRGHVGR